MFETNEPEDWVPDCNVGESELVPISFPEVFPVLLFVGRWYDIFFSYVNE